MIIVPVDGSDRSVEALTYAKEMAEKYKTELLLINVQPKNDGTFSIEHVDDADWIKGKEEFGMERLREAAERLTGDVPVSMKVRFGIPSIEITSEAKEQGAMCIVMGSRGNGPVVSAILGSVSYGVLHLSPCPVTIIPSKL